MSPLQPVTLERFGVGLDLRPAPNEADGAIDLLNVTFDRDGVIRARDGTSTFNAINYGAAIKGLGAYYATDGTRQLLFNTGATTVALAVNGSQIATTAQTIPGSPFFVPFGVPGLDSMYIIGSGTVRKWNGTAFSTPGIAGSSGAVQAIDNRLALQTDTNRVSFSDAGAPETFGANNFVELTPGDGEAIVSMAAWRELLFVFKRSKFFVFYGNSPDGSGNPVFNHRPVVGVGPIGARAVCVARDGVYFIGPYGVYRTTGGPPEIVSAPLDPLWTGVLSPFSQLPAIDKSAWGDASITAVGERIYLALPLGSAGSSQSYIFQYDLRYRWWTAWVINMTLGNNILSMTSFQINPGVDELVFGGYVNPNFHIYRLNSTNTTDAFSNSITGYYRSAFQDFGIQGEKTVRETLVDGTGSVTFQWSRDWGALGSSQSLSLGSAPAIANGRHRLAVRGRLLSWQVSGTAPWSVQRVMPLLRGSRHAGAKTTA